MRKILIQTTIEPATEDWAIHRFSKLAQLLREQRDADGAPLFEVVARDRTTGVRPDPVLASLDHSEVDELWLMAVDVGDGLDPAECAAIERFRQRGGGLLVARDHMDLGSSVGGLDGIGAANHFHTSNPETDPRRRVNDDTGTPAIQWPNYHSGCNGDYQPVTVCAPLHPVLADPSSPTGAVRFFPAHPHEGAVSAPPGRPARVIAQGRSLASGEMFNLAVAFEREGGRGRAIAESTFHHFADYNWDVEAGCPGFVSEAPGDALRRHPAALAEFQRYVVNVAHWLLPA
ncbi:hypothetical protein FHW58_002427 [Duganella sp. 1224]|uniref:hypothetical protein n=1 Tax=Duganella sp. 1224 TaxID=2587052 RepID=UPI0015CADA5B|nr:hypothetical protein [Duganella sp. 1224]NYE61220.1 hypothetical protein [Duganella sp. 1224]